MRLSEKFFRRLLMAASRIKIPRWKKSIRYIKLEKFDLLALVNEDLGRQLMLFGNYEKDEANFFNQQIKKNDICFDVGSNIGYFSLLFASHSKNVEVHAFEPVNFNVAIMKANSILNNLENITLNQTAVGEFDSTINFSVSKDSAYSSIINTQRRPEDCQIEVPLISLDKYIELNLIKRVDILKIDVEGAEEMVINGANNLLGDLNRRPRIVLIELFDKNLVFFNTTVKKIVTKMAELDYKAHVVMTGGFKIETLNLSSPQSYNVIFIPNILRADNGSS